MVHGLHGQKGNIFVLPFFPFFILPLLKGMGVIFLITNRLNGKIIIHTEGDGCNISYN